MSVRQTPTVELESVSDAVLGRLGLDPQVTLTLGIINNTGRDLTVISRSGLKYTLPSYRTATDRAVFFREGFHLSHDADVSLNPTNAPFSDQPTTAQRLYDGMREKLHREQSGMGRPRQSTTIHRINLDALVTAGGTVYVPALDVVLSIHSNRAVIHHPFSEEGVKEQLRLIDMDTASFRYAMYVVDNRNTHADRYINLNGKVFRVPQRHRPDLRDGFYAVHPTPTMIGGVETEYVVIHLPLDEAEKEYQLYRTPEEAETFGFSKEAMERENQTRKREQAQKQDQREEIKYERTEQERAFEERQTRLKREDEHRAGVRRDIVDILKFVSAIVITVTGFCSVVLKLKAK